MKQLHFPKFEQVLSYATENYATRQQRYPGPFLRPGPLGRFRSLTQRAGATGFASVEAGQYGMKHKPWRSGTTDDFMRKGSQSLHGRGLPGGGGGGQQELKKWGKTPEK